MTSPDAYLDIARAWVERAIELNPAGYAERLFEGALLLVECKYEDAIRSFKIAIDDRPSSAVAHCNLGIAHLQMGQLPRAFDRLKRSVALDPFNETAVVALADIGFAIKRDHDVVNTLRYYVEFEQTKAPVWGRLARSLLRVNAVRECILALKHQGSLGQSFSIWNNLGVAYAVEKDNEKSLQAFKQALHLISPGRVDDELMITRNIAQLLCSSKQYELALGVTKLVVDADVNFLIATDARHCDLYSFHVLSLLRLDRREEAMALSSALLEQQALAVELAEWLVTSEIAIFGIDRSDDRRLEAVLQQHGEGLVTNSSDVRLLNNVAFGFAELGLLDRAQACISRVSHLVHVDAYLTATLGLVNFRRGRVEQAEKLYTEAISLAKSSKDKARIRQKFQLELGKALVTQDRIKSRRHLLLASKEREGEKSIAKQALQFLEGLAHHGRTA
jgi:tetratricopeptide (TPR) repeat protein